MRGPTSRAARAGLVGWGLAVTMAVGASATPASAAHRGTPATSPSPVSTPTSSLSPTTVAATPTTVTRPALPPRRSVTTTTAPSTGAATGGSSTGQPSHPTCSSSALDTARSAVLQQLTNRVSQLQTLIGRTSAAKSLTSSDSATLQHDLTQVELPGISALEQKVPADTTCAELWTDAHDMVFDYRVYLVMTPQTDLVIAADTESAVTTTVQSLYPTITAAIQSAQSSGKNVSGAQQAYSDLQTQVSAAANGVADVSAAVLAQTPTGYPGNASVFQGARSSVDAAAAHLRTADDDLKTITGDLGLS